LNIIHKLVERGEVLNEAINLAKQISQSPEYVVKQLISVNNMFFDQIKSFDNEIDTILKSMKTLLGI
jgi:hypothetical protein